MPNFIVLVGVPASGKSTYAKQLQYSSPESDYQIVSRDHYVMLSASAKTMHSGLTYDESWIEADHKQVDKMLNARLQELLSQKANIILDMTNLTKKSRAKRLASVSNEYTKTVMYFPIEYEEMMRRNGLRITEGKSIPAKVLTEMLQSVEIPTADEGFNIVGTIQGRYSL